MPSRPRDIGTVAESAVLKYIRTAFPSAERHPLHGSLDQGDIGGTPFCWEVKGGHAAENASDNQIDLWLGETAVETSNLSDVREGLALPFHDIGFLVTKRKGKGPRSAGEWWVHIRAQWFLELIDVSHTLHGYEIGGQILRLTLADLIEILRINGYAEARDSPRS